MGAKQKYNVIIYERLRTDVCIEAASAAEALHIAEEAYTNGEIILGDRDYDGSEFVLSDPT